MCMCGCSHLTYGYLIDFFKTFEPCQNLKRNREKEGKKEKKGGKGEVRRGQKKKERKRGLEKKRKKDQPVQV